MEYSSSGDCLKYTTIPQRGADNSARSPIGLKYSNTIPS